MYAQAIPLLIRHPSVLAMPLLAGVVEVVLFRIDVPSLYILFSVLAPLVYLWAFGVAIIQANNVWRNGHAAFPEAWQEGRRKFGGIVLAAIGLEFVLWAAGYIVSFFSIGDLSLLSVLLRAAAVYFVIYAIPAAAVGGLGGRLATLRSIRAVRSNPLASAILAIVFVVLCYWVFWAAALLLPYSVYQFMGNSPAATSVSAAWEALVLGYLAFPFAKQYDEVASKPF